MAVFSSDDVLEIPAGSVSLLAGVSGASTMRRTAVVVHGGNLDGVPSIRQGLTRALAMEGFAIVDVPLVLTFERKLRTPVAERELHARAQQVVAWVADQVGAPVATIGLGPVSGAALAAAGTHPSDVSAIALLGDRPRAARSHVRSVRAPALLVSDQRDAATIEALRTISEDLSGVAEVRLLARQGHHARTEELIAEWCVRYTPSVVPLAAVERSEVASVTALPVVSADVS